MQPFQGGIGNYREGCGGPPVRHRPPLPPETHAHCNGCRQRSRGRCWSALRARRLARRPHRELHWEGGVTVTILGLQDRRAPPGHHLVSQSTFARGIRGEPTVGEVGPLRGAFFLHYPVCTAAKPLVVRGPFLQGPGRVGESTPRSQAKGPRAAPREPPDRGLRP